MKEAAGKMATNKQALRNVELDSLPRMLRGGPMRHRLAALSRRAAKL